MNKTTSSQIYEKHHSFENFSSSKHPANVDIQVIRALDIVRAAREENTVSSKYAAVIDKVYKDLADAKSGENVDFKFTSFIADEFENVEDGQALRYLYHRYRYDVFPKKRIADDFPPYVQIEPTSVCNFRCLFCYQTDKSFSSKSGGFMGSMSFELFKEVVDQLQGNVDFISVASRGEPLTCKDIDKMLVYAVGKFLGLKVNTNASLMNEKHAHAILAGGVNTVVFSADAAAEPDYSRLRVRGKLDKTLRKIELFREIKEKNYPDSKIITRVSGVMVDSGKQSIGSMTDFWGSLVDQVTFVKFNPWKDEYSSEVNGITESCTELWRRMFVWHDGTINPCESDYKSTLSVGGFSDGSISTIWRSPPYEKLRRMHIASQRGDIEPCKRCLTI